MKNPVSLRSRSDHVAVAGTAPHSRLGGAAFDTRTDLRADVQPPVANRFRTPARRLLLRRSLLPIAILLAASCDRPAPVEPSAVQPPEHVAGAFDPNSAENTLAWAAKVVLDDEEQAGGDPQALMLARESSRRTIKIIEGKEVRWLMRVHQVTAGEECWIAQMRVSSPPRGREPKEARSFTLTTGIPSPDKIGFFSSTANFPSVPPRAAWLRSVRKDDPVVLVGRIVETHAVGGELLIAIDGHVEMPR